jgi:hypothetical protein
MGRTVQNSPPNPLLDSPFAPTTRWLWGESSSKRKVYIIRGGGAPSAGRPTQHHTQQPVPTRLDSTRLHHHHPGHIQSPTRPGARVRARLSRVPAPAAPAPACADWGSASASARRLPAPRAPPREGSGSPLRPLTLPRSPSPAARRPAPPLSFPLPAGSSPVTLPPCPLPRALTAPAGRRRCPCAAPLI